MNPLSYEEYQQKLKKLKTLGDVTEFAKDLIAPTLQVMLEGEMDKHLGYPKHHSAGNLTGNSRNGYSSKKIRTNLGAAQIQIPRDRNGEFDPIAVQRYETTENDVEEKIIAMYAKGMTTTDINRYMEDIYKIDISSGMVSAITDKVFPLIKEWQIRPLSRVYPFVYMDGLHFKVRDGGKIVTKCAYIILGISIEGRKEILGIWIGGSEGAKFWMQVLSEIKNRGVEDILICCVDGLTGFPDAIKGIFPETIVQQCVVHQIRNTVKFVSSRDRKKFCSDLRSVYTAPTEEAGLDALQEVKTNWKQYEIYLNRWEAKWTELSPFFSYPEQIRRIIYTTNAIENLNRQFRKVTKTTTIFPHNEALQKLLWLAQRDLSKRWTMPIFRWGEIISQLVVLFPERISLDNL